MEKIDKLYTALAKAERMLEIKKTLAWEKDLAPSIRNMIIKATGGLIEDKWVPGKVHRKDATEKEMNQAIGYASAAMDIYNSIDSLEPYINNLKIGIDKLTKAGRRGNFS